MPARRTPRPLRTALSSSMPGPLRNYDNFKYRGNMPSADFDWDRALYLNACTMRDLGYTLTPTQQKRIDDHDDTKD